MGLLGNVAFIHEVFTMLVLNGKEVYKGVPRDKISGNSSVLIHEREILEPSADAPKYGFNIEARLKIKGAKDLGS